MPNQEHKRERERDQIDSYWYIPSAPRVNYSLLIMEQGPDWFLVATEACGGGTFDLGLFLGFFVFIGFFGVGFTRRWASR